CTKNHSAPSGPAVITPGVNANGIGNSSKIPPVVTRPILLAPVSANHKAPSRPVAIDTGSLDGVGIANSRVTIPLILIRATLFVPSSMNHMAPSEPVVIPAGPLLAVGTATSLIVAPNAAPAVTGASRTTANATPTT